MGKREEFVRIFKKAERKYGESSKRLAGEKWGAAWRTLIATIMSAQSRDETTIKIASELFKKYEGLGKLAKAKYSDVIRIFKGLNYNKTKTRNVIVSSKLLISNFNGNVPDNIEDLTTLPGVGRKTANLILSEVHKKDSITIDTHCFRLLNALGIVHTKTPKETEMKMMKIAPKKYWSRINRIFVLWGKDVRGRDKKRLLRKLDEKIP